jgi:hypothetical protein
MVEYVCVFQKFAGTDHSLENCPADEKVILAIAFAIACRPCGMRYGYTNVGCSLRQRPGETGFTSARWR